MDIIIATLIVVVVIASALSQDLAIFSWDYWLEGGNALRSEVVRNLGLLAAAGIGLVVGSWRAVMGYMQARASQRQAEAANEQADSANQQARIAQEGHITNLFSTAVEHLGSEQLPVRLGGIYALWRLIKDSPERDVISVIDILCAFVRDPPHSPVDPPEPDPHEDVPATEEDGAIVIYFQRSDVQAILDLIGDQDAPYRSRLPDSHRLNLTNADLRVAMLTGADLTGANLWRSNLDFARLAGANLSRANLANAYLTRVNLHNADLTGANLQNTDLTGANLTGAILTGTVNLTQGQLGSTCIWEGDKPPTLPNNVKQPDPWKLCPEATAE